VVLERSFAEAIGAHVGDNITLGGRSLRVGGTAVSAALPAYPSSLCHVFCFAGVAPGPNAFDIGLVWLTPVDLAMVGDRTTPTVVYLMDLRLADPAAAPAFAAAHGVRPGPGVSAPFLLSWQQIRDADAGVTRSAQAALQVGAVLLALLAVAGLAVLAGRRTFEQTRRVGLLKAVGATPRLIAGALLIEHLLLAVLAAAAGLAAGRLLADRFTSPGAGLLGTPSPAALTGSTVALVAGAAVLMALTATLVPALRAARSATVIALEAPARAPGRSSGLIGPSPGAVAARVTPDRPAADAGGARRAQHRGDGDRPRDDRDQRDRRRRGYGRAAQPADRTARTGHHHHQGHAAGPGRREHGLSGLDDRGRRPPRRGAGPSVRHDPTPGHHRTRNYAGRPPRWWARCSAFQSGCTSTRW
jgi:putative ABC transport system permease protein